MLTPMMLGVTVTFIVAGEVTTRTGRTRSSRSRRAIMALGMYLLTGLDVGTSGSRRPSTTWSSAWAWASSMQMVSLIAQQRAAEGHGRSQQRRNVLQQIGGSLGVAAFGAIFARLTQSLATSGVHVSASGGQLNPATVTSLPAAIEHDVFSAIAHAVQGVFIWALPAALLIFVLALFIKEVPLRGRAPEGEAASQQAELVS